MKLTTTLQEILEYLEEHQEKGCVCPACGGTVKVYHRKLNAGMVSMLLQIYRVTQEKQAPSIHVSQYFLQEGKNAVAQEYSKLRFWRLLRPSPKKPGHWEVTPLGEEFILGRITVPRVAFVLHNEVLGFSLEHTGVRRALGDHFNYEELLGFTILNNIPPRTQTPLFDAPWRQA